MISKVYEDPSKPIRRIYNECVVAANDIRPGDLPQFDNLRSKLFRERQSLIPEIPNEIEDVDIVGEYSRTWDGDSFLSRIDNDWEIAVFATEKKHQAVAKMQHHLHRWDFQDMSSSVRSVRHSARDVLR